MILCSTGAIMGRPGKRDFTLLAEFAKKLDCDGFEFLMLDTWYEKAEDIKKFFKDIEMPIPIFHIEKGVGDLTSRNEEGDTEMAISLFRANCDLAKALGSKKLVLHLWSGLDSDKDMDHNMECYEIYNDIAHNNRLVLTVENVVCNRLEPMSHMMELARKYPEIQFTFDTKMAAFHNQLELLYKEENKWLIPFITHMHINDYAGGYKDWKNLKTLHMGEGHIDFNRFFEAIRASGYNGSFTVEATSYNVNGVVDFDSLNKCFEKIRNYIR